MKLFFSYLFLDHSRKNGSVAKFASGTQPPFFTSKPEGHLPGAAFAPRIAAAERAMTDLNICIKRKVYQKKRAN